MRCEAYTANPEVEMPNAPQLTDPENLPVLGRPLPDTFRETEKFCRAMNESRVHFVSMLNKEIGWDLHVVVDPPAEE
jgi:hypothetical protein